MKNYTFCKQDFETVKEKNLELRHLICDLIPFLEEKELEAYKKFFKYSENLEKRIYLYT